ncbi:hypothetical protein FQN52_000894 [Onygenales sp. PD_12]|nr:hypothetical protein FQN52_000894 [Onygenales sp. PD_12]KAK2797018.1 hypothetical protein FQN51_008879 [Onygenales sp. PD_10]
MPIPVQRRAPNPYARPAPLPENRLALLDFPQVPSLVKRQPDSTSGAEPSRSCGPDDTTGYCERAISGSNTQVLPIALGVAIPVVAAIIVLLFLHRRNTKRLRSEDANDKHKSLDFGMDIVSPSAGNKRRNKGGAEMSLADTEKTIRRGDRGLSLDIGMTHPYLLPPGLHGSRESLHSLSRSIHADDDKYRPATTFSPTDGTSMRSFRGNFRAGMDDSSSYTDLSSRHVAHEDMNANLLQNAQRMSRASPPAERHSDEQYHVVASPPPHVQPPTPAHIPNRSDVHSPRSIRDTADSGVLTPGSSGGADLRKSTDYLGAFIQRGTTPETPEHSQSPPGQPISNNNGQYDVASAHASPRTASLVAPTAQDEHKSDPTHVSPTPRISLPPDDDQSDYGDEQRKSNAALPQFNFEPAEPTPQPDQKPTPPAFDPTDVPDDQGYRFDTRRLTVGIRPLPPEDPSDNPEQRANRIRSFYKEYFDESSKPAPEEYYEDYGPEDHNDEMMYYDPALDPYGGADTGFYPPEPPPFAQPMARRAMTPPPRMPPRFNPSRQGAASAFGFAPGHRSFSSVSGDPGPRALSSISNRVPMPRRPMPPPAPLHVLPTPSKLTDDTMIMPIDYAPALKTKDRREGRPETPQGGLRAYHPMLPAHIPLASSYDDLSVMPSPHALRKSGTFTALDFAPPPRFRNENAASDAGSIRSNRSGVSSNHAYNIRNGAYRVSRLPQDTVGTRENLASSLRPKWDMSG